MEDIAEQLAFQVSGELPAILQALQEGGFDPENQPLQLECSLTAGNGIRSDIRVPVAALSLGRDFMASSSAVTTPQSSSNAVLDSFPGSFPMTNSPSSLTSGSWKMGRVPMSAEHGNSRPSKQRKYSAVCLRQTAENAVGAPNSLSQNTNHVPKDDGRRKRVSDNPALAPSTFDKFVGGVWESIYFRTSYGSN